MSHYHARYKSEEISPGTETEEELGSPKGCMIEKNIDYRANNKGARAKVETQEACAKLSFSREGALFWTFQPSTKLCWPKTNKAGTMTMDGALNNNSSHLPNSVSPIPILNLFMFVEFPAPGLFLWVHRAIVHCR